MIESALSFARSVMAGPVPAIHAPRPARQKAIVTHQPGEVRTRIEAWMAGTGPAMTARGGDF